MNITVPDYPTEKLTTEILMSLFDDGDEPDTNMLNTAAKVYKWKYTRMRLAEAQNWRCCWCSVECVGEPGHAHSATTEHVVPRSQGGSNNKSNLAMACANCNHRRGSMSVEEFLEKIKTAGIEDTKKITRRRGANLAKRLRKLPKAPDVFQEWLSTLRSLKPHQVELLTAENEQLLKEVAHEL